MHYRVYNPKEVEFLDITSVERRCAPTRAVSSSCSARPPTNSSTPVKVSIDIPVSNGYYVNLNIKRPITLDDVGRIRRRMQEIIDCRPAHPPL